MSLERKLRRKKQRELAQSFGVAFSHPEEKCMQCAQYEKLHKTVFNCLLWSIALSVLSLCLRFAVTDARADADPVLASSTSVCLPVFVQDSSASSISGKTGLAYNTASIGCSYYRSDDVSSTAITLASSTLGTYTSGAFKEVDATNMPGVYEFCPPNAAFALGVDKVTFLCDGAADMAPMVLAVPLEPVDGLIVSESTTTIGLASGAVSADDQFNTGFALVVLDSAGKVNTKSCISDSVATGDTVVTADDISSLLAVGDRYILQPDAACQGGSLTLSGIAGAVWGALRADHKVPGSFGKSVLGEKR